MTNPLLTVYGPTRQRWWAVCALCHRASRKRFYSADEAASWEHDCRVDDPSATELTIQIVVSTEDAPEVTWASTGRAPTALVRVAQQALSDMLNNRDPDRSWEQAVRDGWEQRRIAHYRQLFTEMEEVLKRPYVCPGCKSHRSPSAGGLKNHMRCCFRIDPFRYRDGGYDHLIVPGGGE